MQSKNNKTIYTNKFKRYNSKKGWIIPSDIS